MVNYLYSACDIYSYTWKDTSILSSVKIFMKNQIASKLPCDISYMLGPDFEVHRAVNMD